MKKYWHYAATGVGLLAVVGGFVAVAALKHENAPAPAHAQADIMTVSELGITFQLPDAVPDLVYQMGNGPETAPAADFSSTELATTGGEACSAGNHVGVSGFPLGQVVVSEETPQKVAVEVADNPDDGLGEFITQVGNKYLYYNPAPDEPCSENPQAQNLQKAEAAALRQALKTAQPIGASTTTE